MNPKSIFASKTVWFNLVAMVVQVLPGLAEHVPQPWGELVTALGNIALRYVTTQPVKL